MHADESGKANCGTRLLTAGASQRGMSATAQKEFSALLFIPNSESLSTLRKASKACKGCPLFQHATQTVFGEGAVHAAILFVGEQPCDHEDIAGKPFVGPAGQLLDKCLAEAGIDRNHTYVTKHGESISSGNRRGNAASMKSRTRWKFPHANPAQTRDCGGAAKDDRCAWSYSRPRITGIVVSGHQAAWHGGAGRGLSANPGDRTSIVVASTNLP